MKDLHRYRIQTKDRKIKFTGIDSPTQGSWFTIEQARELVNHEKGERIVEHDGVNVLWEVF